MQNVQYLAKKIYNSKEISPDSYNNLPQNILNINITGGEPFLRDDLGEVVKVVARRCPKAEIVISTNGFVTDLICLKMQKLLEISENIGVAVSLDGIGNAHDEIRGVKGYNKVLATITRLKAIGIKNLKIAFTLGNYNTNELKSVYNLANFFGLEFSFAMVHSGENYFSKYNQIMPEKNILHVLTWLINRELETNDYKKWGRAYFAHGTKELLLFNRRLLPDYSGRLNIFIDPYGFIFPNNVSDKAIGHLEEIDKGLGNAESDNTRNWMMCTARAAIKKHWIRVGWWVLWNK